MKNENKNEQSDFENDINDNTYQIAKNIFSNTIKPSKFYSLQLHEISRTFAEEQGVNEYIQGILSIITIHGIEIVYGHRDLNKLKESEIDNIKLYVKSYGYSLDQIQDNGYLKWVFTAF